MLQLQNKQKIFNYQDYLELNKDLSNIKNKIEAEEHWNIIGSKQLRLCNKKQLEVINEFSNELILYIPYYYYLYCNNLLFDNKIITYKGMKPLYYFINSDNIIEKEEKRRYIIPHKNFLILNDHGHCKNLNKQYWYPPPYKSIYKNNILIFEKPIIVIHNKYNIEWNKAIINFINVDTLRYIFNSLKDKYQIIYIRPINTIKDENYSFDYNENSIGNDLQDYKLIDSEFSESVIKMYDLLNKYNYIYNELLLMLYSNCDNYISTQGGASITMAFFYKKMLILHINGGTELTSGVYNDDGLYHDINNEPNKKLVVCRNYDQVKEELKMFLD